MSLESNPSIEEIQRSLLGIASYFDKLCEEIGVTYYLMGGSALGAIRHKGFIPWDDDFDVFMTYQNYSKFLKKAKDHIDNDLYYLQQEDSVEWPMYFSKLRKNGTTFIEQDTRNREMHQGLYIDIMCLNNVSDNKIYHLMQYTAARILTAKTIKIRGYLTTSLFKKTVMNLVQALIGERTQKLLIKFVRSKNQVKTTCVGHFFGRAKFRNTSFPFEYLGVPRYVSFADTLLPVPDKVEKYLCLRYGGKFMELPDKQTRDLYPQHHAEVDLHTDYKEYQKKGGERWH